MKFTIETISKKYEKYSARGLVSSLVFDEIDPKCDPLSKDNKIFLSNGFLAGSNVTSSGRLSLGTKSPLTKGIKESSSGGVIGGYLGRLGIRAISIEGCNCENKWHYIYISKDKIELKNADFLIGKGCYQTTGELLKIHGKKVAVMSIGQAGENQYLSACISVTDKEGEPTRQFGRGGVGAVMGSKKIKAIVVDSSGAGVIKPLDEEKAKINKKFFTDKIMENPVSGSALPKFGTGVLVNMVNAYGALPTMGFRKGFFEFSEDISGERISSLQSKRGGQVGHSCMPGCVIRCSNIYNDEEGNNITGGLEYESLCLLGSNLGISSLDNVARLNRLCDDIGVDSIEFGASVGLAMDSGVLDFGNYDKCVKILENMSDINNYLSRIIGQGVEITGKVFNNNRIPAVKGQAMAAYDPRTLPGMGMVYSVSPMGADHTAAASCTTYMKNEKDKHSEITVKSIIDATSLENTGLCRFTSYALFSSEEALSALLELIYAYKGIRITKEEYLELGKKINAIELKYNELAGLTEKDNRIPSFMLNEKLEPKNEVFDIEDVVIENIIEQMKK
jgi:aldehyde:ferredoxin oxidoreductase